MEIQDRDRAGLQHAIEQARIGRSEGGVPIGGALIADDGTVLAVGHNRRVQQNSAIRHGETDALENGGRLPASVYRRSTMYTTLSPCDMCTGRDPAVRHPARGDGREPHVRGRRGLPPRPWRRGRQPRLGGVRRAHERVHRRASGDLERGHRRGVGWPRRPHDVVDRRRAAEALERQRIHFLGLELVLHRGEEPLADQDLAGCGRLAQA